MLSFLSRNNVRFSSKTQSGFLQNHIFLRLLSVSAFKQEPSLGRASDFLVNKCGQPSERDKHVSSTINLENLDDTNAVMKLFNDNGLSKEQISRVVNLWPQLLSSNSNKSLLPKLRFLESVGASSFDICMILHSNMRLLTYDLETRIIPLYKVLKSVLNCNDKVFTCMRRLQRADKTFIEHLDDRFCYFRELGMPSRNIENLLLRNTSVFASPPTVFNDAVKNAIEIGCDPTKPAFVTAIKVMVYNKGPVREAKLELYQTYGLSEKIIWSIFKANPLVLVPSVTKLERCMDFLVSKIGFKPAYVARHAVVFHYSFHNRIVPRCSVLRVLHLKGLIVQEAAFSRALTITDEKFLNCFVNNYPKLAPQLLSILQKKQSIHELGYDVEEKARAEN